MWRWRNRTLTDVLRTILWLACHNCPGQRSITVLPITKHQETPRPARNHGLLGSSIPWPLFRRVARSGHAYGEVELLPFRIPATFSELVWLEAIKRKAQGKNTSSDPDLNEGPADLQSAALTPELPEHIFMSFRELLYTQYKKQTAANGSRLRNAQICMCTRS